jgi:hypothetical protein
MKKMKFASLQDFKNNYDTSDVSKDSLFIFDIDGVFFKPFSLDWFLGRISNANINAFQEIISKDSACWIFTNRPRILMVFKFMQQLKDALSKFSDQNLQIFKNSYTFLQNKISRFAVIMNARKPSEQSQKVIEKGIKNFKNVIYIAARHIPINYPDKKLIEELEKRIDLTRLTFVDIS